LQENWSSLQFSEHEFQFWRIDHECQMANELGTKIIANITDLRIQSFTATHTLHIFLYLAC
jgi:hypothetical protein